MKKSFITVLTALITAASLLLTVNATNTVESENIDTATDTGVVENQDIMTMENDRFSFHINKKNGCFKIIDNENGGNTYYSNPTSENGDLNSETMYSQLSLEYYSDDNVMTALNSYEHSSKLDNLTVSKEKNIIKAVYTFGKLVIKKNMIPACFTEEEFEELLKTEGLDTDLVKGCYELLDKESGYYEEYKNLYPLIKKQPLYVLDKYTADYKVEKLYKTYKSIGFDIEKLKEHNKKHDIETKIDEQVQITIPVEYRLEKDGFKVSIPCKSIETTGNARLTNIKVLPFYESAFSTEEGYMLLPDGSGAIINFSNSNVELGNAAIPIYGLDNVMAVKQKTEYNARGIMPIYGINKGNKSSLAIIENGDAMATVYSSVCGKNDIPVTSLCAGFTVCPYELITVTSVSSKTSYNVYSSKSYEGNIDVRFLLLGEGNTSYAKMASAYRKYLIDNNKLTTLTDGSYPLSVEFLGAITKNQNFLGIPYKKTYALTTYNDAATLINKIKTNLSNDLVVKYTGWCNGGLIQGYAGKVKNVSALGNKNSLKDFNKSLSELGIKSYFNIDLQQINEKPLNLKVNLNKKGARCVYKDTAIVSDIDLSTMGPLKEKRFETDVKEVKSFLLSSKYLQSNVTNANKQMAKLNIKNVSYGDIGSMLYSDFSDKNFTDRQGSLDIIRKTLDENKGFAVNNGDFYTLKNADMIYNMPLTSSKKLIYDREIPFAQIVLHGCVQYSGTAINLSSDPEGAVLKAVETGAVLNYTFASRNIEELKNSSLNYYYSVSYDSSKEGLEGNYRKIAPIQSKLSLVFIAEHEYLTDKVTKTVYDDGTEVIVNYGTTAYEYGGNMIAPGDFSYITSRGDN